MALFGKFRNAVGASAIVGMSAFAPSVYAQSASGTLESLPSTPITTLASANSNTVKSGESSLTESANTAASERRLTRSERNRMARDMDIAEEGTTSFGFLMDDNSNGEGFYRIQLDFKNDRVPDSVIEDEIARFRDNSIIFLSPYSSEEHTRSEIVKHMNLDGKNHDPHHPAVQELVEETLQRENNSRRFIRQFGHVTSERSDTNVVIIEVSLDVFQAEYNRFLDENNTLGPNGTPKILSDRMSGVRPGHIMIPGTEDVISFSHGGTGDTPEERDNAMIAALGTLLNRYDGSFMDLATVTRADNDQNIMAYNRD